MLKKFKPYYLLVIPILIVLVYWGSWNAFFQQDEWFGLSFFFSYKNQPLAQQLATVYAPVFIRGWGHMLLLTPLVNFLRYTLFGLWYPGYAILSILFHIVNTFLVYKLLGKISKNNTVLVLIGSLFFAIASASFQAVTWASTSIPTQLACAFSITSCIYFVDWIKDKQKKSLIISCLFLFIALGFKETAIFLIPLYSIFFLKKGKDLPVARIVVLVLFILFLALRFFYLPVNSQLALISRINYLPQVIFFGISQTVLPFEILLFISEIVMHLPFINAPMWPSPQYALFLETQVARPVMYIFGICTFFFLTALILRKKIKNDLKIFVFGFSLLSFIPLVFVTEKELASSVLPERNLYLPLVGISLIFVLLFNKKSFAKRWILLLLCFYLSIHIHTIRNRMDTLIIESKLRKNILQQITTTHPDIADRTIFYTRSNQTYYGLPDEFGILPFQSGFGKTLLVWYDQKENFPTEFLNGDFLWEIRSQGYEEVRGKGFGYVRDFELLKELVKKHRLPDESIVSFSWDGYNNSFTDISDEVRTTLKEK